MTYKINDEQFEETLAAFHAGAWWAIDTMKGVK